MFPVPDQCEEGWAGPLAKPAETSLHAGLFTPTMSISILILIEIMDWTHSHLG